MESSNSSIYYICALACKFWIDFWHTSEPLFSRINAYTNWSSSLQIIQVEVTTQKTPSDYLYNVFFSVVFFMLITMRFFSTDLYDILNLTFIWASIYVINFSAFSDVHKLFKNFNLWLLIFFTHPPTNECNRVFENWKFGYF